MKKKFSIMLALIFCALLAQAQDTPPDAPWESDPLDVLEPPKQEIVEPTVPEFKEVPEPGHEESHPAPQHTDVTEPALPPTETMPEKKSESNTVFGSSDPDYSREAEFHRIYKTYNEQPTSVESWEKVLGARQGETIQVQKGDTLSGISGTLFGDPLFWPKVWSLNNSQILNPHEIEPGMNVQFFPGSLEEAPTLQVDAPVKAEKIVDADGNVTDVPAGTTKVTLPKAKKRAPLLKKLPGSLPQYKIGINLEPAVEVQVELPKNQFPTALESLNYYISDAPVEGVGVITATEMNMKTAGDYQYIYVRLNQSGGKEFIVQKNMAEVKDPSNKERRGQMVEIQGEIEVLERVNDQKDLYRAIVKKSIQPLEVGAILTPGKLPMIDPSVGALTSGVGAKIMGGQFDKKRSLFGSNSIVFLDAGSSQGLQEGQTLAVYADERVRNKKNDAVQNDRVIGTAKIVRVSNSFATAYIAKATDDILLGDYVGHSVTHASAGEPAVEPSAPSHEDSSPNLDFEDTPSDTPAPNPGTDDSDLEL